MSQRRTRSTVVRMTHVTLASAVTLNGGDAAIAYGSELFLRWLYGQGLDLTVIDDDAEIASRYHDFDYVPALQSTVSPPSWPGIAGKVARRLHRLRLRGPWFVQPSPSERREVVLSHLRRLDVLASQGGTFFVDQYRWHQRLDEYEEAMRVGVPIVFLTQSMGPFTDGRPELARLGRVLEYATTVMVRDSLTVEAVGRITPDANVIVAPDMAFALAREVEAPEGPDRVFDKPPRVGVSVRQWPYFEDVSSKVGMGNYRRAMASAVSRLVREWEASVTFISTCQGIPEYRYDDSQVADEIVGELDDDVAARVEVDRSFSGPMELVAKLSAFDVMVSTRMHGAILAWVAGTPVVPVAYEPKTSELFDRHELSGLVHRMEGLDPRGLVGSVEEVLAGADNRLAARERAEGEALELSDLAVDWGWP